MSKTFYLVHKMSSIYQTIGEESFGYFYVDDGFDTLKNILDKFPVLLSKFKIVGEDGKPLEIEQFLKVLDNLKIRRKT